MNLKFWTWHKNHPFLNEVSGLHRLANLLFCNLFEYRDIKKPVEKEVVGCKGPYTVLMDGLYLRRFYVIRRGPWKTFLHCIVRSDNDRHMHDHPWDFSSLCLVNGYDEELPVTNPEFLGRVSLTRSFRPGQILRNKAEHLHKVQLLKGKASMEKPAWTLVRLGEGRRVWGFMTEEGWFPWYIYLNESPESPYEEDNFKGANANLL